VILGMHRSGTSFITRLVNLLGFSVCHREDLLVGRALNPRGHWESKSLLRFNDRLLGEHGRSWFCPPALDEHDVSAMLRRHRRQALAAVQDAHPQKPWVWKDPRTCVLLPFWSSVLEQRAAYVLVVRHPFEVSDSLATRNGCTPLLSLALWERYTREAMLGAAGRPLMVCTYDGVLADPVRWCERLVDFLAELGVARRPVEEVAIEAFAMAGLRHSHRSWSELEPGPLISHEQVALAHAAREPTVQRRYAPPPLPAETPANDSLFADIARRTRRTRRLAGLPAHLVDPKAVRGRSGGPSRPPVSVVLAPTGEPALAQALDALAPGMPAGAEVLLCAADADRAGRLSAADGVTLRAVACEASASAAAALALAAGAADGELVVITTDALLRCEDWYASLREALARPGIGGVGAVIHPSSDPARRCIGASIPDEELAYEPRARAGESGLVPTVLLSGAFCGFTRPLLAAAGGIDPEFRSAEAAVAELSLRLWRMGFRCCTAERAQAWVQTTEGARNDDVVGLYDRLRIARLHLDPERLRAFTARVSALPAYRQADEELAGDEVQRRRTAVGAVCAFPLERAFNRDGRSPTG